MTHRTASALFASNAAAGHAVTELRAAGVPNPAISVLTPERGDGRTAAGGAGIAAGLLGGGALGLGAGVAALAIPGVGPLIAAGAIAAAAVPGMAALGGGAGAVAGGLAAMLRGYGVDDERADRHEREIGAGGVLLLVDTSATDITVEAAQAVLDRNGGRGRATVDGHPERD